MEHTVVEALVDDHNAALVEVVTERMEDMGCIVEGFPHCDTGGEVVVDSNSRSGTDSCMHCTFVLREDMVDSDYIAAAARHLVASALPADDDCSSCRRGRWKFSQTERVLCWIQAAYGRLAEGQGLLRRRWHSVHQKQVSRVCMQWCRAF